MHRERQRDLLNEILFCIITACCSVYCNPTCNNGSTPEVKQPAFSMYVLVVQHFAQPDKKHEHHC